MNTDRLHEAAMAKLSTMSLSEIQSVCVQMGVEACPGREDDKDELLDAVCDASWDGQHGTSEEFDRRLATMLGLTSEPEAPASSDPATGEAGAGASGCRPRAVSAVNLGSDCGRIGP